MNRHTPRKRFGQNFLRDNSVIERIVDCIDVKPDETLLEIGPGQGALTFPLLKRLGKLTVVELDRDLIDTLTQQSAELGELSIFNQDALSFDLSSLMASPVNIVGNLPYNISTPLLFHLLDQIDQVSSMTFMLQKEVVDRLSARVNDSNYSRLSVMVQFYCEVERCFDVAPEAFYPQPKIVSSIVKLTPRLNVSTDVNLHLFSKIVKQAFSQRRKVLKNNLKQWLDQNAFDALGISPSARAQELSMEDFRRISLYLQDTNHLT